MEKYREKWLVGKKCHEVVIDEWPGLPPYIEVDCSTKKSLLEMMKLLKLDGKKYYKKGAFDYYEDLYNMKDRSVLFRLNLKFDNVEKTLKKYVRENKSILAKLQKKQKKYK